MRQTTRIRLGRWAATAAFAFALALGSWPAGAATQYLGDGAKQNNLGKWDLPTQGLCYTGASTSAPLTGTGAIPNKAVCTATITGTSSAACAATGQLGATWKATATQNVCLDVPANQSQGACVSVGNVDRVWSGNVCLLSMKGYNRNKVSCNLLGGTYGALGTLVPSYATSGACVGAWVMPDGGTFTPPLVTSTAANGNPGPGDQCLRCHRSDTEWNTNRVRDVETFTMMGHKNMVRKVDQVHSYPWAGANGTAYPSDGSGNHIDWPTNKITISGALQDLNWIYGGWFESPYLPSAIYKPASGQVSYSCGRCHTTGWTSDAAVGPTTGNLAKEPEKSFPGISYDATLQSTGWVKLGGGVAGDARTLASWDLFGITCTRCHGSMVDNTSGTLPYSAPTGYDTHNNGLTAYSSGSGNTDTGYCSVPGPALSYGVSDPTNAKAACTAAGGTWLTTACSDGVSTTQVACVAAGKTWSYPWCSANSTSSTTGTVGGVPQAYCSTPGATFLNQAQCTAAAGTWTSGACSVAPTTQTLCTKVPGAAWTAGNPVGFQCYLPNPTVTSAAACAALTFNGGTLSPTWTNAFATDVDSCKDAGGKWTDTKTQRGQIITATCMGCHRQETTGLPNGAVAKSSLTSQSACAAAGYTWTGEAGANGALSTGICVDYSATDPGQQIKVGPNHNTIQFVSHYHGNQYLNSPHGKFTSTFDKIATGKQNYMGTGEYKSFFIADGEALNTGNGCTGCHNVHKSTNASANPAGGAVKECTECHPKPLSGIKHPTGVGTPLENPAEACATCHMPGGLHFFRINATTAYSTFPSSAFGLASGTVNAATTADGTFTNAVWVDLNLACGQCHGGGTAHATTTGSITAAAKTLTVANAAGFATGEAVSIAGAASVVGQPAEFDTYVASVAGNVVTLVGAAGVTVTNAAVVLNPTKNGAAYFDKPTLAGYAAGMHDDKPTAAFTYTYGATGQDVNVDASGSTCGGSNAACNAYAWSWGDGTAAGSGKTASHHYATAGNYTIVLTVDQYGVGTADASQRITIYAADNRPVANGACSIDYTTWNASCTNTSTDDKGVTQIVFDWGDGTVITNVTGAPPALGPYTHTYLLPGTYTITIRAYDAAGQSSSRSLSTTNSSTFAYNAVSGRVLKSGGLYGLGAATIQVRKNGTLVKSTMTAADGSYTSGSMKPGTYTLTVSKAGYTFTTSSATVTIPPSVTTLNFTAN